MRKNFALVGFNKQYALFAFADSVKLRTLAEVGGFEVESVVEGGAIDTSRISFISTRPWHPFDPDVSLSFRASGLTGVSVFALRSSLPTWCWDLR